MRKLTILFALLTLNVGLWAQAQSLSPEQQDAIAAIDTEVAGSTDADILEVANAAKTDIEKEENVTKIAEIKSLAIYKIWTIRDINNLIGDRTRKLFDNVVIKDGMTLLKHAENETNATAIRKEIMDRLVPSIWVYDSAKAEALGTMGEPCDDCPAVEVKKGDKVVTLYAPESVNYIKNKH